MFIDSLIISYIWIIWIISDPVVNVSSEKEIYLFIYLFIYLYTNVYIYLFIYIIIYIYTYLFIL